VTELGREQTGSLMNQVSKIADRSAENLGIILAAHKDSFNDRLVKHFTYNKTHTALIHHSQQPSYIQLKIKTHIQHSC